MLCRHKASTASTRKRIYSVTTKPSSPSPGKEYTLSPQSLHRFHPEKNILYHHKAFTASASTRKRISPQSLHRLHPEKNILCHHKAFTASTRKRIYSVATKLSSSPPGKEYTLSPQHLHRHHQEKNIYILCNHKASTASTRKRIYSVIIKPSPSPPERECSCCHHKPFFQRVSICGRWSLLTVARGV